MRRPLWAFLLVIAISPASATDGVPDAPLAGAVRIATFNAALEDDLPGAVLARLETGTDAQARLVAEVIQRVRPDILVLQELDRDEAGRSLAVFAQAYLSVGQNDAAPIEYPDTAFPPSNTGVPLGIDLNGDGNRNGPADAAGFGHHPGQYAFAVLSRWPITVERTFRTMLWRDVPENLLPAGHYSQEAQALLPLSSKTHLVAQVATPLGPLIVMAAHPTPPVFDDPVVDWNGRRNADEIRLLADLLRPETSAYAKDDAGVAGGMPAGAMAVVAGDLNADPERGDSRPNAIAQLLTHPDIISVAPTGSRGTATAEFIGGLRVDYVLPTRALKVVGSGVFWPAPGTPLSRLNGASDHRLVWIDVVRADNSTNVDIE